MATDPSSAVEDTHAAAKTAAAVSHSETAGGARSSRRGTCWSLAAHVRRLRVILRLSRGYLLAPGATSEGGFDGLFPPASDATAAAARPR